MTKLKGALSLILVLIFITMTEAVTPIFLQAIASALATIPFAGGPMTTGLVGAKLGIGTKLLYYLGYFGRGTRRTSPKPAPKATNAKATATPKLPEGLQPMPLPYMLSGAGGLQQMGGGGFGGPANFQQMGGGGFGGPANFQQMPFGGFEPSQVFQALRSQGYDANTAMQIMNYGSGMGMSGGGGGGFGMPPGGFGMNAGGVRFGQNMPNFPPNMGGSGFGQNMAGFPNGMGGGFNPGSTGFPTGTPEGASPSGFQPMSEESADVDTEMSNTDSGMGNDVQPSNPASEASEEGNDVESFFTFLQDMDDNGCISRLICDIGADPSFLGDFSENIHGIVGSLDVQPSSRAFPYIEIMESGKEGGCSTKFLQCSDSAYSVVKSIAPSVGVPQSINAEAVNNL